MSRRYDRERSKSRDKSTTRVVICSVLLLLIALSLIGSLGGLGDLIKSFMLGVFGFGAYFLLVIALGVIVLKGFRLFHKRIGTRLVLYSSALFIVLMLFLQVITTNKLQVWDQATYKGYLSACYSTGVATSGGLFFGLITYPLLKAMGRIAAIPLAVVFFVILFFALYPFMRDQESAGAPAERREPEAGGKRSRFLRNKAPAEKDEPLRLFVDRVRPGQKDARKIKMRNIFSKKQEEPTFFDPTDTTPLNALEGLIPAERAERLDPYLGQWERKESDLRFFEEQSDNYRPAEQYTSGREYSSREEEADLSRDEYDEELPAFVKNYAGARAEANRKLYGRDDLSSIIPEEPRFDREEAPAARREVPPASATGKGPSYRRPQARPGDIISDIGDLRRINEKQSTGEKRPLFIGEEPKTERRDTSPASARQAAASALEERRSARDDQEVMDRLSSADSREIVEEQEIVEQEEITEEQPKDLFDVESDSVEEQEIARSVITPRDASMLSPRETRTIPEPILRQASPAREEEENLIQEEEAEPIRTRKPRSDIGGTHRTSDASSDPSRNYIPPKQAKQLDIEQVMEEQEEPARPYTPPPVTLLQDIPPVRDEEGVEERAETLVQALASFNIESQVIDHKTGPTFTQYAVTLPDNMSVNKLTPLEKDIKRKLMINKNIRIIPSVPGLDAVGIEVPNKNSSTVGLRSIISAPEFEKEGKLYFVIGVDVSGKAVYGDLLKMPHLLVAGSTGSGKSVCLNVLICSIMYHYPPEMVRFIMIDPKQVELSVYRNMPHMLMPSTVIEPDKAINALTWAVNEMERRYHVFMESGCRNIGEYNVIQQRNGGKKMYYIVLIVDEMADLMANAKRDVEDKVGRITSKARAAGIHLVVATQRPSVDVITGTIKNNIPTRIAFKVTSFTDSKTILDRGGAESLFGFGDMLYAPPEGGDPIRLQGPYIDTDEISSVVDFVKSHNDTRFDSAAEKVIQAEKDPLPEQNADSDAESDGEDEYFAPALLYFIKTGQASISKLQVKYRIGYGRAARIVATMEERGYLGPSEQGNKSRQVNMTLSEYYELYGEDGIEGDEAL